MDVMQYGRYQLVSELGRGAMGVVYKAYDPQIDRMVALKVLRQDRVVDQEFVRRFTAEARAIGRLSHPNIVTVFDVGEDHGTIYIAMEFLEGRSLDLITRKQRLSLEKIVDLGIQVAEALDYAHGQGIIHRDIKPANIIVTSGGHVKVTDFGIARIEDASGRQMTQMGEILGTPTYMPPEQVSGQPVDGRSDIYAVGVLLYELATGRRPFSGDNLSMLFAAIGNETPPSPSKLNPAVPKRFSDLIMECLSKSPAQRYQNGRSLAQALKTCLFPGSDSALPGGGVAGRPASRMYVLAGVGGLVLLALAAAFYFLGIKAPSGVTPDGERPKPIVSTVKESAPTPKKGPKAPFKEKSPEKEARGHMQEGSSGGKPAFSKPTTAKAATGTKSRSNENIVSPPQQKAMLGALYVQSTPSGAEFYLDGEYKGATPYRIELPYGKYEIRLQHKKYFSWEAQINIDRGGEIPLRIRLMRKE